MVIVVVNVVGGVVVIVGAPDFTPMIGAVGADRALAVEVESSINAVRSPVVISPKLWILRRPPAWLQV